MKVYKYMYDNGNLTCTEYNWWKYNNDCTRILIYKSELNDTPICTILPGTVGMIINSGDTMIVYTLHRIFNLKKNSISKDDFVDVVDKYLFSLQRSNELFKWAENRHHARKLYTYNFEIKIGDDGSLIMDIFKVSESKIIYENNLYLYFKTSRCESLSKIEKQFHKFSNDDKEFFDIIEEFIKTSIFNGNSVVYQLELYCKTEIEKSLLLSNILSLKNKYGNRLTDTLVSSYLNCIKDYQSIIKDANSEIKLYKSKLDGLKSKSNNVTHDELDEIFKDIPIPQIEMGDRV